MTQTAVRVAVVVAVLVLGIGGLLTAGAAAECTYPVTVEDHSGTTVELQEPADRVVVLEPAAAQIVWTLGAEDRVVGMPVGEYTSYLEGSETKPDVVGSSIETVDVETVIAQRPDLVIAPNYAADTTIEQLRAANLTVYQRSQPTTLDGIYAQTRLFGQFLGVCNAADRTVVNMRQQVETIKTATTDRESPRVLYYFFGYAAGSETFIGELLTTAGGENVAAEAGIRDYDPISKEIIAQADPEWIVTPSHAGVPTNETPFAGTTAVESGQVLVVDADLVSQSGPRVVTPLNRMAHAFHPNATLPPLEADVNASTSPAFERPQPGFGVAVAVAALLVVSVIGRRWRKA